MSDKEQEKLLDEEKIIKYLNEKNINTKCALCGNGKMFVEKKFVCAILPLNDIENIGTGRAMPLAALICPNCGHTIFINPLSTGLLIVPSKEESSDA